ncbi:MAG: BamA/TamA family outer membrane protein, partial [Planctomycetaceae bacterium]|nr:BamA/TamA family outer membrane protein [Planctomycetaceae bacterium]
MFILFVWIPAYAGMTYITDSALESFFGNCYISFAVASAPKTMRIVSSFVYILICFILTSSVGYVQEPYPVPTLGNPAAPSQTIVDVRIEGNIQKTTADLIKIIKTKTGRPFNETILEEDKRTLMQQTWFVDVKTKVDRTPEGYIVTFLCVERQLIHYIKVVGNKTHTRKILLEEANIKEGDALDPIAVHQAAERIKQFYRESGFHQVHIEIPKGDELGDRGVVFLISEGPKQRVLSVDFEGNQIATGARLKTLIQSKPGIFFWVNSEFTRKKLDDDVETLTNYYRKLGFFYAKIDRVFEETKGYSGLGQNRGWVNIKFVIDEGPRCKIRDIRFTGNNVFSQEELLKSMKLASGKGKFYNQDALENDMQAIKEKYGDSGYVFAMPLPDPRLDQDYVDLVIGIREGPRCYLETLDVEIVGLDGAESYTKWHPVLNRTSLRPGDLLRTSEINATKRRLIASQLFNSNPTQGTMPEFIFDYPKAAIEAEAAAEKESQEMEAIASGTPQFRGQAPQKQSLFQKFLPAKLSEPTLKLAPENRTLQQNVPSVASPGATYRGQSPANYTPPIYPAASAQVYAPNANTANWGSVAPAQSPLQTSTPAAAVGMVPVQYQVPAAGTATILGNPYDTLNAPSNVRIDPNAPPGVSSNVYGTKGLIRVQETRTGSLMASVAVSSDAGLMGRFVYEEQNFDILNYPKGFRVTDWRNAYRGKGQRFRIEAVPGTQVQRYSAGWNTPYWHDLDFSFGVNGYYYQRYYNEWYEDRIGGGITLGKLWTQDIQTQVSLGGQTVKIYRPQIPVPDLLEAVGNHPMYNIGLTGIYNTRDSEYMPTEGHMVSAGI